MDPIRLPVAELDDLVLAAEAAFEAAIAKAFRAATEKLLHTARAMTAAGVEDWVSVDDARVAATVWEAEVPGLAEHVQAVYTASGSAVAGALVSRAGLQAVPAGADWALNRAAADYLETARNRMVRFGDAAWSDIRSQLVEGFRAGEGIEDMARRLRGTAEVSRRRARVVARTEVISASNTGAMAGAMSLPDSVRPRTKTWLATHDRRTRESHVQADGQTVAFDGKFLVGGWRMSYPGEWGMPAAEVINCRCTVLFDAEPLPDDATAVPSVPEPISMRPAEPEPWHMFPGGDSDRVGNRTWRGSSESEATDLASRVGAQWSDAAVDGAVRVRVSPDAMSGILRDGRFRTQHEVGRSAGVFDPTLRRRVEHDMFGEASDSPIYGYVDRGVYGGVDNTNALYDYGSIDVELKGGVTRRTTVTIGDSLQESDLPAPVPFSQVGRVPPTRLADSTTSRMSDVLDGDIYDSNYVEAQIHGGLSLDDIAGITTDFPLEPDLLEALRAAGIRVTQVEPY